MKEEMVSFSKTLDKSHLENALAMKKDLEDQELPIDDSMVAVSTRELFEKAF